MKTISSILMFVLATGMLLAQPGQGMKKDSCNKFSPKQSCKGIPGVSDEQKKKIDALSIPFHKEMLVLKNQMGELKAKQKTLTTAEKPDMKVIYANIDEITKTQNLIMKKQAEHRQQVRNILDDQQKLWFDSHGQDKKGCKKMKCNRQGSECKSQGCGSKGEGMRANKCPNSK